MMWSVPNNVTCIKICEIESWHDMYIACQAGAHALGLHWFRHHDPAEREATFATFLASIPPGVHRVLLSDLAFASCVQVAQRLAIDTLQLYPDWSAAQVAAFRSAVGRDITIWKLLSAQPHENCPADIAVFLRQYDTVVDGFLLDSYRAGGTGKTANWDDCAAIVRATRRPVVLAGGLTADNVSAAIARVRPFGVDVESGVSDRRPDGTLVKNRDKCCRFVSAVRRASCAFGARLNS